MAQNSVDFSVDPSGDQLLDNLLTPLTENLLTSHSGSSRPSYAVGKTVWVDTTSTPWLWKMFNGTNDIVLGEIDPTGLVFTPSAQVEVLNNFSASANPTVNDDSGDGYSLGSTWYYNGNLFRCVNATVGAAVWVDTGLQLGDLGALALKNTIDSASLIDNSTLTYVKLASSAIAALSDLVAGTASKLVDAATFKSYMDTYIFAKGQTWQNVTASRAVSTTYTNSTGRPIMVSIFSDKNDPTNVNLNVDGVQVAKNRGFSTSGAQGCSCVTVVVPNGSTYSTDFTFTSWVELR